MVKIILENKKAELELDQVDFDGKNTNNVFAYKRSSGNSYAVLTKLNNREYGWVAFNSISTGPTYVANKPFDSLKLVLLASRDVRMYSGLAEFVNDITTRQF